MGIHSYPLSGCWLTTRQVGCVCTAVAWGDRLFQQFRRSTWVLYIRGVFRPKQPWNFQNKKLSTISCWETPHAKPHSRMISFILAYNPKRWWTWLSGCFFFKKKNGTVLPSPVLTPKALLCTGGAATGELGNEGAECPSWNCRLLMRYMFYASRS